MESPLKEQLACEYPLIGPEDPAPYTLVNPEGTTPVLLVCDHAGRAFPRHMNLLGLDPSVLDKHVAWDIGSRRVGELLAERLDATAVQSNYSRLIVDCNRQLYDATAFVPVSDGIGVPGNQAITDREKWLRVRSFYWPYHNAITRQIQRLSAGGKTPAVISVHSCTPVFDRIVRPWHIGVLWDRDPRIARPLLDRLETMPDVCEGDNEPYSGRHPHDFTIDFHAEPDGLPHVGIEIRQDLIDSEEGARHWAGLLGSVLAEILDDQRLYVPWSE